MRSIAHAYPRRWPPGDAATARGRTTPVLICPQQTYSKHDSMHSPARPAALGGIVRGLGASCAAGILADTPC